MLAIINEYRQALEIHVRVLNKVVEAITYCSLPTFSACEYFVEVTDGVLEN